MRRLAVLAAAFAVLSGCQADQDPFVFPAKPAADFGDSVGVNTKVGYQGTPLGDCTATRNALTSMGIKHVRDEGFRLAWDVPSRDCLRQMGADGTRLNLGIVGCMSEHQNQIAELVEAWRASGVKPYTESLENPNEVNWPHSACSTENWPTLARDIAARIWFFTRGDDVKIAGPSFGGTHDEDQLGDISDWLDWGNMHPYRGTGIPETAVADEQPHANKTSGNKPVSITEFGWQVPEWATERAQGIYTMRAFLDHFDKGIPRSFVHQIVDFDGTFGLYRNDWTPKPAATYLGNLMHLTGANLARTTGGSLTFGWRNAPADARFVLLRAPSFYAVVAWRAAPHDTPTVPVTIRPGQTAALVRRFDPTIGRSYRQQWTSPGEFTVNVGPSPVVLRVWP